MPVSPSAHTSVGLKGTYDRRFDLSPVRLRLAELVPGVDLLDNLRFDPGEKANDPAFVDRLVQGFDYYVNDAFGACHRAHASIVGPPARLPSAAGRLLAREVAAIGGLMAHPARPFLAVVGGAKVTDKLGVLRVASRLGRPTGRRRRHGLHLPRRPRPLRGIVALRPLGGRHLPGLVGKAGDRILLPTRRRREAPGQGHGRRGGERRRWAAARGRGTVAVVGADVPDDATGLDIGPVTCANLRRRGGRSRDDLLERSDGRLRGSTLRRGHLRRGRAIAGSRAFSVVGGGDSVAALDQLGLAGKIGFVSTGGGASLELLEHGDLPGLLALRHAPNAVAVPGH